MTQDIYNPLGMQPGTDWQAKVSQNNIIKDKSLDEIDQLFATQDRKGQTLKQQLLTLKAKWEREARIDELKSSLDKLIVQEGKLYKMFKSKSQEDRNICVGIKIMADRVRCLYDHLKELGDK